MIHQHAASAWRFRHFILSSIRGELKSRFARSRIGALWHILHPLAMAAIYALVLSKVLGARLAGVDNESAYAIYLIAGIASWGLFSEIVNRCMTIFIDYGNPMKKIAFPRIALPVIILGGALINHALLLAAVTIVFAFLGNFPSSSWLFLPAAAAVAALFAFGLGLLCGVLNVFTRDVAQVMGVAMQLWFWLTPIVYTPNILPDSMQRIIGANPMTSVTAFYQNALLHHQVPDWNGLLPPFIIGVILCLVAAFVFRRASAEIVDVL